MLIELMKGIGTFYYLTWFVWPFVFVFSFVNAIFSIVKNERTSLISSMVASISLLIILAGVVSPVFH